MQDEFRLRGFQDCERSSRATEVKQAVAAGEDILVVAGARAEMVAKLVIASTEPLGGAEAFEPPYTSCSTFHAAAVLLKLVIFVGAGAVHDTAAKRAADCSRIGAVAVGGDLIGRYARDCLRRAEESLGRLHVAVLAQ